METTIDIHAIHEIRCRTHLYLGVGAINKCNDIFADLKRKGIERLLIVTGRSSYIKCGAWAPVEKALAANGIAYVLYNGALPNPEHQQVDEAVALGQGLKAQAVLGIGGGSPIDTAKSAAILLAYPGKTCKELYTYAFTPDKALPVVAINTTHGTGTEVNRFAVVSIPEMNFKPAIAYDCSYPMYAIDDPALMVHLPASQTLYVSLDALNHVTEAATTIIASSYSILLAKETIRLVAKYLPAAIKDANDLTARYHLVYASAIAGIAFDNSLLHYTHALEHPLSAIKTDLTHALGLSILLPSVLKTIYASKSQVLNEIYAPIVPGLTGTAADALKLAAGVEQWLGTMGVTQKLGDEGFTPSQIPELIKLAQETPALGLLLSMSPVPATEETIRRIYAESFAPISQML